MPEGSPRLTEFPPRRRPPSRAQDGAGREVKVWGGDISIFIFFGGCVQNIETHVLAGFGYGLVAQNIDPQWLAGKIFRNKGLPRTFLIAPLNWTQRTATLSRCKAVERKVRCHTALWKSTWTKGGGTRGDLLSPSSPTRLVLRGRAALQRRVEPYPTKS
jgi:hypothetical protein